jgi:hypothetical protein
MVQSGTVRCPEGTAAAGRSRFMVRLGNICYERGRGVHCTSVWLAPSRPVDNRLFGCLGIISRQAPSLPFLFKVHLVLRPGLMPAQFPTCVPAMLPTGVHRGCVVDTDRETVVHMSALCVHCKGVSAHVLSLSHGSRSMLTSTPYHPPLALFQAPDGIVPNGPMTSVQLQQITDSCTKRAHTPGDAGTRVVPQAVEVRSLLLAAGNVLCGLMMGCTWGWWGSCAEGG